MNRVRSTVAIVAVLLFCRSGLGTAQAHLPDVRVAGRTPCEVHPETAVETADLWTAAREALEGATRRDSTPPVLLVREWRRTLDLRFRLQGEHSDTAFVRTRHPFEKPAPGNLERAGYIQRQGWSMVYYGPDAGLLLSESFLRRHCFERVTGSGPTAGLVGLAFTPLPTTAPPDVSGVLWIDDTRGGGGGELRHVEYAWTNPPEEARAPGIGGRTDFARLSSGGWIVQRWNIRMPRSSYGGWFGDGFDGYTDQGGEVLAVQGSSEQPNKGGRSKVKP